MVNKLNNLILKVEKEKGEILLFMLWKNLPEDNTWSVIISADWVEQIGQSAAMQYWIDKIRSVLTQDELRQINRVGFLKPHDRMVLLISSAIRVTNAPIKFSKNQVGDLYIEDAVIFRSKKTIQKKTKSTQNRNPIYNHTINPIYNHTINPIYNHTINPIYNHTINPIYNHTINPIYNHTINPIYNHTINPIYNHTINPIYNHTINPIYNHTINPIYNPSFLGYYLYDDKMNQTGYLINANDNIILLFNLDHNLQAIGTKNSIDGYTFSDTNQKWIGTMIPNGQNGFLFYSQDSKLIGHIN